MPTHDSGARCGPERAPSADELTCDRERVSYNTAEASTLSDQNSHSRK